MVLKYWAPLACEQFGLQWAQGSTWENACYAYVLGVEFVAQRVSEASTQYLAEGIHGGGWVECKASGGVDDYYVAVKDQRV